MAIWLPLRPILPEYIGTLPHCRDIRETEAALNLIREPILSLKN